MNPRITRAYRFGVEREQREVKLVEDAAKITAQAAKDWRMYCAILDLLLGGAS